MSRTTFHAPALAGASLALVLLSAAAMPLAAQSATRCGAPQHHAALLQQDPAYAANRLAIEAHTQAFIAQGGVSGPDVVRRIPVVVHVVYSTPAGNVSDAQVQSQIAVLNEDFRRTNPDAGNTLAQFQPVAADCEFQFCLAAVNPLGGATTGITRTQTAVTAFAQTGDPVMFTAQGGIDAWPRDQYLNIWVCALQPTATGPLLGYAQFPGGSAATDGVVINTPYFGRGGSAVAPNDGGRTATHEVGHWLDLFHIWGDNEPNCGDDQVADTPAASNPNYGCPLGATTCGGLNMAQNYMDYTDDACMNLFTQGQKARMQALFAPGGFRAPLLTSPAACPSGPATPLYQVNSGISTLLINGVAGTTTTPAVTTVQAGNPVSVAFQSTGTGLPWDTALSFAASVPAGSGAYVTPGGQLLNLNPGAPFLFVNSGTVLPAFVPFAGSFTTTVAPQVAVTVTAQQAIVTPSVPDGYAMSQAAQLTAQ